MRVKLSLIVIINLFLASIIYFYIGGVQQILYINQMKSNLKAKLYQKDINYRELFNSPENFVSLLLLLRDRVLENPHDVEGWKKLVKLYNSIENYRDAKIAQQHIDQENI